jgi:hypothetical protein
MTLFKILTPFATIPINVSLTQGRRPSAKSRVRK